jgi:hypothetical protein
MKGRFNILLIQFSLLLVSTLFNILHVFGGAGVIGDRCLCQTENEKAFA